ncbi:reductase [Streptomyces cinnamoneus]|uniref:Bifunctional cytochrome P450/NADPH--P450 reductase n=1 Tax=Streptomyces cinnamoneus TaxID=53446 RepID=A0A2G1XMP2_STRCJ|nr:cytochrome P450 [Streptomyces cinnamoneus]PHQ52498.1 reductase [Streptomyces cinnamoneus]PPT16032.1 cytochrome P450 [Streptomyces cinnamoneus]
MTHVTEAPVAAIPVVDISAVGASDTPLQQIMRLARRHGPVFRRRLHGVDRLFVTSLDLVTELADEERFTKHVGPALENVREFTADGLFTAYNHEANWAKAHDILLPAFALGSMRAYHPAMLRVARRLTGSWDARLAEGGPVDVPEDMTRMTLDTIGLAGFGYDFESFARDEPHPFVGAMVRCLDWSMNKLGRDPDADHSAEDAAFRADAAFLAGVVDDVIAARTATGEQRTDDLLGLMLGAPHPADGTTLDAANIRNQVITFLIAGHETTSGALSFALHHLLKDPVALRLAQRETDELWGDAEDPEPTFEDIGRLRWIRQVLNEALRLWPTAAAFAREAREDTLLGGRYPLRAGEGVTVLTPLLHRDPVWGDNPELFDPTRFAPEAEAARSPHAYKPFGTGERACIGRQFALHEATMLLGLLVHRYRFLDTTDYRLRVKETLTLKPDGFTLSLARRTAADRLALRTALRGPRPVTTDDRTPAADGSAALPARARQGTGLLVLHGSAYGTCRDLARDLADEAARLGFDATVAALDERVGALPHETPVVIVAASYNGRPTDDATDFAAWAEHTAAPGAAEGVHYAVLGVGDRNWAATYQRVPTLLDERLAALGGTRLLPRAAADASGDLTGTVEEFTRALRHALLERYGDPDASAEPAEDAADAPAYTVTEVTGGPLDALAARHDVRPMTVTEAHDLTAPGHPRTKRFLRLALPDGVAYRTADHLAVLPANDPALVERAAGLLGVHPDTVLSLHPRRPGRDALPVDRPLTVRELLTHHLELQQRPTARQLAWLADRNPCPPEQAALRAVHADDPRTVLDLIEDHPALRGVLGPAALLELLPPLRPRIYSVSSSPAHSPRHIDLMVSVLAAPARSGRGEFRGTGSNHLAGLRPGDTVWGRVQPCRQSFRIDHQDTAPLLMVAAGTGLAPFRGAVADRHALATAGAGLAPALLYFGCDAPDADFLHEDELRAAERAGAVSLRPAFSERPGESGPFVQHRIAAEGDEVWSLLEAGARVYVCGDGSRMAPGVRAALRDLCSRRTGVDAAGADAWLRRLTDAGRYVEDVYAG